MGAKEQSSHSSDSKRVDESERWEIWLEAARVSIRNGAFKEAEAGLRLVLELKPDSVEGLRNLCVLLLQQRRETEAERIGKQLLKLQGGKSLTWARLRGKLRDKYIDKGDFVSKRIAKKLDSSKEEKLHDAKKKSMSYLSRRLRREPQKSFREIKRVPDDEKLEHVESLPEETREVKKETPKHTMKHAMPQERRSKSKDSETRTAEEWFGFGQLYARQSKFPDAERALKKALAKDDTHLESLTLLGEVLYKQQKYPAAIAWFTKVLDITPRDARIQYLLGISYSKMGKFWEASQALYKSVAINDRYIDAWAELGIALAKQGRHEPAQKAYLKALKERRNNARLLTFYGVSLRAMGKQTRATNIFRMAVSANPDYAPAWDQLGQIMVAQGRFETAKEARAMVKKLQRTKGISAKLE